VCEGDPGSVRNPALPAAIAPKAVAREKLDRQVTGPESKHPVTVTRLKTSVTWAKSIKLVTLTVKPFAFGHNL
jgi:hypothetical protein